MASGTAGSRKTSIEQPTLFDRQPAFSAALLIEVGIADARCSQASYAGRLRMLCQLKAHFGERQCRGLPL